jgi:hypothetical protein
MVNNLSTAVRSSATIATPSHCTRAPILWIEACVGYIQYGYSFMPANAALRCQSNKADWSSWARDDGVLGTDL